MRSRWGVAMLAAGCVWALAEQAPEARRQFDEARHLFEQRQWDGAQAAATRALAADPQMGDAEVLLGLIATVRSQFADAEKHFARAVKLQPQNDQAYAYLGSTYLQEKRFSEAADAFRKVLALNPGNVAANYNLGLIALERNSPEEALRHFAAVVRARQSDVPGLIGMLESQLLLRQTSVARETAQKLDGLLEDRDPRLFQVAALLAQHDEPDAAIPMMERARKAFPQSYDVNYNLALACFQTGKYDRAAEVLGPFALTREKAEAVNLLGAIEEKRGHVADAEHAFEQAARLEPANEDYRFDYGNSLVQHGKNQPAVAFFRGAAADLTRSWKLRVGLGAACYLAGDYENAAEALLEAVRLKPDLQVGYFLLGEAYDSSAHLQPAILAALAAYLKTAPRDPWAYYHYGSILYARAQQEGKDDYQVPVANLNQALRLDPKFAEAYLELGIIALDRGQTEQSIRTLEKAVSLDPRLAAARYRLGLAYQRSGNAARAKEELDRFRALKDEERYRGRVLESLASMGR